MVLEHAFSVLVNGPYISTTPHTERPFGSSKPLRNLDLSATSFGGRRTTVADMHDTGGAHNMHMLRFCPDPKLCFSSSNG